MKVAAALVLTALSAWAQLPLTLDGRDAPNDVKVFVVGGQRYVDAEGLAAALGGSVVYNSASRKLVMTLEGKDAVLTIGSPYVVLSGKTLNVFSPVEFVSDRFAVPLQGFAPVVAALMETTAEYDAARQGLVVGKRPGARQSPFDVYACRVEEKENGVFIELYVKRRVQFDLFYGGGDWIDLSLIGATVDTAAIRGAVGGPVKDVRFSADAGSFNVSWRLARRPERHAAEFVPGDPPRIRISLPVTVPIHRSALDVVVIDAGHGGIDPGAVGADGTQEKDVTLDIARRLERILREELKLTVVMTRDGDEFIPLSRRAQIANEHGAMLFVSIHTNANRSRQASGTQTFFLAEARNDDERAAAALENAALRFELPEDVDPQNTLDAILLDVAQSGTHHLSSKLAETMQTQLADDLETKDRGLGQAGFYVLRGAYMPAVLVETAFISNAGEEKLLTSDSFRAKVARSVADAIKRFKTLYDSTQ